MAASRFLFQNFNLAFRGWNVISNFIPVPLSGFDHWLCVDFQDGPEFLGFQILEVCLIRNCAELLKGRMEKIRDDIAEGTYDFFLEM